MTVWGSECFGTQSYDALTEREREIALMLSNEGISNKEIGQRLHVAEGTVKIHMCNIFRKLGISKRASLNLSVPEEGVACWGTQGAELRAATYAGHTKPGSAMHGFRFSNEVGGD